MRLASLSENASRGFIVPIGGAESRHRRPRVLRRFVELCGGPGVHLAVIPTASTLRDTGSRYERVFRDLGADRVTILPFESPSDCESKPYLDQLDRVDGVFMTGGDQVRLTGTLGGTAAARKLCQRNTEGLHVAGTSAGAAVLSDRMIARGDSGLIPRSNMVQVARGLGLTTQLIIDQHFGQRERRGRLLAALAQHPEAIGIGVDEDTAAFIGPDNCLEVVGSGSVTIIDPAGLRQAPPRDRAQDGMGSLIDLRMHVLAEGAVFDIGTRTAYPQSSCRPKIA